MARPDPLPDFLPDFLIVGAMKSGTSTLAAQLAAQPGIFMSTPKEPNFFSDDDVHARGLAWYRSLFEPAAPGDLKGEASTHYTKLPTYPATLERLSAVLAAPRIVYVIRDPVERLVSHYLHERSLDRIGEDLDTAVERHPELVDYGRYAMQIAPFVERFGAETIHLTSLERMGAEPEAVLAEVAAFIGYDGETRWQAERARENASADRLRQFPLRRLLLDNRVATELRRRLVPKRLRTAIRTRLTMTDRPEIPPALAARLEAIFAEDRAALERLLPGARLTPAEAAQP